MTEFKRDDQVVVTSIKAHGRGFEPCSLHKVGRIAQIDGTDLPVLVRFDDDDSDWGTFEELQLVIKDTSTIKQKLAQIEKLSKEVQELLG